MIIFNNVSKLYPSGYQALSQVSFALQKGEMAFVTGHSGAGKTTLLKLIAMIERPSRGSIILNGKTCRDLRPVDVPFVRRSMGIIFQNPHLLDDRSIFDNVALPLTVMGYSASDIKRRVRVALDKVNLLSKENAYPIMLSGGEQQRVGIARAIVHQPILLLADEPTGNLDPALSAEIMRLFSQLNELGTSVLIASHDLALIAQMQYRILVLRQGKLVS